MPVGPPEDEVPSWLETSPSNATPGSDNKEDLNDSNKHNKDNTKKSPAPAPKAESSGDEATNDAIRKAISGAMVGAYDAGVAATKAPGQLVRGIGKLMSGKKGSETGDNLPAQAPADNQATGNSPEVMSPKVPENSKDSAKQNAKDVANFGIDVTNDGITSSNEISDNVFNTSEELAGLGITLILAPLTYLVTAAYNKFQNASNKNLEQKSSQQNENNQKSNLS
jgi:hypothetical protein